jgi:nucleoid-associated protein EbfC
MFGNLMEQFQMMKLKMEEVKENLATMTVTAESAGGAIKVTATGTKKIKAISIASELQFGEPEELEEQLTVAINRALEKAEVLYEREMQKVASGMMPPGMI